MRNVINQKRDNHIHHFFYTTTIALASGSGPTVWIMENICKEVFMLEEHLTFHIMEFSNIFLTVWGTASPVRFAPSACKTLRD